MKLKRFVNQMKYIRFPVPSFGSITRPVTFLNCAKNNNNIPAPRLHTKANQEAQHARTLLHDVLNFLVNTVQSKVNQVTQINPGMITIQMLLSKNINRSYATSWPHWGSLSELVRPYCLCRFLHFRRSLAEE